MFMENTNGLELETAGKGNWLEKEFKCSSVKNREGEKSTVESPVMRYLGQALNMSETDSAS